jgi:hypothetical protein
MANEIFIILSNTGTLFSRAIGMYTKAAYNHTSIGFDRELNELYSFGRKKPKNPLIAGFVRENLRYFPNTRCCIYRLEVDDIEYSELRKEIERFEFEKERYRYNFIGLFGIVINYPIKRDYHYFCSQFVATVLDSSGTCSFQKDIGLVTPSDFHYINKASLVYEGSLSDYSHEVS